MADNSSALPIAGDLNLDGVVDDVGDYDPATRSWYYADNHDGSFNESHTGVSWAEAEDLPFAGALWQY